DACASPLPRSASSNGEAPGRGPGLHAQTSAACKFAAVDADRRENGRGAAALTLHTSTCTSGASRGEFVLKAQKVKEIPLAAVVAVGVWIPCCEGVLEAEEIKEIQFSTGVAVRVAIRASDQENACDRRVRI